MTRGGQRRRRGRRPGAAHSRSQLSPRAAEVRRLGHGRRRRTRARSPASRAMPLLSGERSRGRGVDRGAVEIGPARSIVDVGEGANPLEQLSLQARARCGRQTRLASQLGPECVSRARCRRARGPRLVEERRQVVVAVRPQLRGDLRPTVGELRSDVVEHDRLRLSSIRIWQPDGQEREARLDLASTPARVRPVRARSLLVEAELLAVEARRSRAPSARPCRGYGAGRGPAAAGRSWRSRWGAGTARCRPRAGRGPR